MAHLNNFERRFAKLGSVRVMSLVLSVCFMGIEAAGRTVSSTLFQNPDGRSLISFQAEGTNGIVAAPIAAASKAGLEILKHGGNAVDAAICASFVTSVLKPHSTGIGGGGFMLYFDAKSAKTHVLDFRERAPAKAMRDMYIVDGKVVTDMSRIGHRAVAVPGLVAGLLDAHSRFGRLELGKLMDAAIQSADEGFSVYPELARALYDKRDLIARNPAMRSIFFNGDRVLKSGDRLNQRDLAATLRRIKRHGRNGFYGGRTALAIEKDMKANGGLVRKSDLTEYRVKLRDAVSGNYRGYEIVSMPPPSSGGVHLIQILNVLEGYDLKAHGFKSVTSTHVMVEAMRQAYADRAQFLGDPDFHDVPVLHLVSKGYAEKTRKQISLDTARESRQLTGGGAILTESESTAHISVIDANGNVVSTTQTINSWFGACVVVPDTGIVLNNEMDDFSVQPGVPNIWGLVGGDANAIEAGKTPLSSMSPTLVLKNNKPVLVLGSPGGSKIITAVLQTIINVIDYGLPLDMAVAEGRTHHQWLPDRVLIEKSLYPSATIQGLRAIGHDVEETDGSFGEIQAIQRLPGGRLFGISDPRRSGGPAGY
jgi:gamma-glutamyltranspeptidase/glutathione hydrolase